MPKNKQIINLLGLVTILYWGAVHKWLSSDSDPTWAENSFTRIDIRESSEYTKRVSDTVLRQTLLSAEGVLLSVPNPQTLGVERNTKCIVTDIQTRRKKTSLCITYSWYVHLSAWLQKNNEQRWQDLWPCLLKWVWTNFLTSRHAKQTQNEVKSDVIKHAHLHISDYVFTFSWHEVGNGKWNWSAS